MIDDKRIERRCAMAPWNIVDGGVAYVVFEFALVFAQCFPSQGNSRVRTRNYALDDSRESWIAAERIE